MKQIIKMGTKAILPLLAVAMLTQESYALKYRTYTLAELIKTSDAIVVAKMSVSNQVIRAVALQVFKGNPGNSFSVDSTADRDDNKAKFIDGETALLFLSKVTDGSRLLLGYGDQGKWPRKTDAWPYSTVHVVPLETVEKTVQALMNLDADSDQNAKAGKLKAMLASDQQFDQSSALEYLESSRDQTLLNAVRAEVEALRGSSTDWYIKAMGDSVARSIYPAKESP